MQEVDQMHADWLNNFRDWGANFSYDYCLWRLPVEYSWNLSFLRDRYLLISETAEVRLRYLTIVNASIRFPCHVLEIAMEHGINFKVGVKSMALEKYRPESGNFSRTLMKARISTPERHLIAEGSALSILGRWLSLLGVILDKPGAVSVVPRGGGAQWIARAFNYGGLLQSYMNGPSIALSVFHHGGDDSGDDDCLNLHWDELAEEDYQNIFGYVRGPTQEEDTWIFPPDEVLDELLKHYHGEWNKECDETFHHIKNEWCGSPCRGRLRTKKEWKKYFHTINHGRCAPKQIINDKFIEEGRRRLARAFGGMWNKMRLRDLVIPEQFKPDF
jgi:hypothetical protein